MTDIPVHLPLIGTFGDSPDVLLARVAAAASSTLPHGYRVEITTHEAAFEDLAGDPACLGSVREARSESWEVLLGDEDSLVLVSRSQSRFTFLAYGTTPARARAAADSVIERLEVPALAPHDPASVLMEFCHTGSRGVKLSRRRVDCPDWDELAGNYPAAAASALESLAGIHEPTNGRLILLWGAPGTGKTTAVRALSRRWAPWCRSVYVLDPEMLLSSSEYFHELIVDGSAVDDFDDPDDAARPGAVPPWRLLVIEDADEVIRSDARHHSGQALGRLLNLTDGIVGQGMKTLVLLTTNEPLTGLHPALVRPGRCLAQVEIGALGPGEVQTWLERHGRDRSALTGPATLAELYALDSHMPLQAHSPQEPGLGYL